MPQQAVQTQLVPSAVSPFVLGETMLATYHEERSNNPVENDTKDNLFPQRSLSENRVERLVPNVTKNGVHHDQQTNCYPERRRCQQARYLAMYFSLSLMFVAQIHEGGDEARGASTAG